jgi:polyisoprenyl-phosphate glycosyltransferase
MPTLSVVVPVYFNEGSLPELFAALAEVERQLAARGLALELVFVDDGSGDGSLRTLLDFKKGRPATKVVKLSRNFGAVHASKTGLRYVTGDCFMWLAADLQDPPELIVQMADLWRQGQKFVICVREQRADSAIAKTFARVYYALIRALVIRGYPRGGFDLALMSRELLPYMVDSGKNVNTPLYAYWLGFTPVQIPYQRRKRRHGRSRWTFLKRVAFLVDSLLGLSIVPMRLMSLLGAIVAVLSFSYGALIGINTLRGVPNQPGFPTLVVIISFLFGVTITMLGTIGEYLWRIYDEVTRKPEAVVEEVF